MSIPNLSETEVAHYLTYDNLTPLMRQALAEFSTETVHQPVRQMLPIEAEQRYFGIMPVAYSDAMGAKLVCFYPKNANTEHHTHLASIILFDPEFGQPLAFMDGRLITEMRTAATSAAVSQVAANPNSRKIAFLGSGVQAHAHLDALKRLFPLEEVAVWSRNPDNAQAFAAQYAADFQTRAASAEDAVIDADIVVCATNAMEPVLKGAWLKPGAHVNSVGSPRPNWRELDDATMANVVIVDSYEAANTEAGDVILSGTKVFAEAGEIFAGKVRLDPAQTTVFKSVGIAIEDLAAARLTYDLYQKDQT